MTTVRIATRGSTLALWQARHVASLLAAPEVRIDSELVVVSTVGDRDQASPLSSIGGKGVFVKEVQAAVLDGRADVAVHSAKDLPAETPAGLVLACTPERGDPRDTLVGGTLDGLGPGALVATGSARRRVQLADLRPDLTFTDLRGNIETRLGRVGEVDAVVVARAALDRLGTDLGELGHVHHDLDVATMVPQVGQGALAVECRVTDDDLAGALAAVEHPATRREVDAERGFLTELGGDCTLPAGAHARATAATVVLTALLAAGDGHVVLRDASEGDDPAELGRAAARRLLDERGGSALVP